jgi:thioredoxin
MSELTQITDDNFEEKVIKSSKPVLVDFWATWCRPCLMVAPILEELSVEFGDRLTIYKVDVDNNNKTASRFSVMSIPTMILFKDGKPASHLVGFKPKEDLKRELEDAL